MLEEIKEEGRIKKLPDARRDKRRKDQEKLVLDMLEERKDLRIRGLMFSDSTMGFREDQNPCKGLTGLYGSLLEMGISVLNQLTTASEKRDLKYHYSKDAGTQEYRKR